MADLTTETIERAMQQLRRNGYAGAPAVINFFDRRNRTAGTLRPERLKTSVRDRVLANVKKEGAGLPSAFQSWTATTACYWWSTAPAPKPRFTG